MARGAASPAPNALPKVSFVKVTDEITQQPPGVHDHVAKSYGYNDFNDEFVLPEEHYIRHIEPLESDLATQVEYDMDEQDQEWLDAVNQERKAQQLDKVSYETFEIIMDRLEKEWFDLSKNVPKSDMGLPSEDSTCAICDDSEGENTNAIVFCDGCNLAVHQDCYGVPYIPEGQWLCRKCTVSPENPVSCVLCPNEGGAFKQTVSGEWVHLLCAIWVPETGVANEVFMEPITGVDQVPKPRWRLRCSVCNIREGACIQCTKASCFIAFHATCARKEKFLMPMKATQGSEAPTLACYCEKHLPREQLEARMAALMAQRTDASEGEDGQTNSKSNKSARAYAKTYKPGPPLVPRIIVNRILQYISRISIRHKPEFVQLVCRYWSLKREARRGAPLLKRLHLEPWTALSGSKQQTDEDKVMKLDQLRLLRLDLERVRLIIDVIRHREAAKQRQQEQVQSVLSRFFFPHEAALRFAFEKIISHDRQEYFKSPVNKNEVPDYYDIIVNPMCWDMIDRRLDSHEYLDLAEFKGDVELVVNNALSYNQPNTPFYKTALRIQSNLPNIFSDLDKSLGIQPQVTQTEKADVAQPNDLEAEVVQPDDTALVTEEVKPERSPEFTRPPIGDLEPPLNLLEMLVSEELIRQDTNIVMMASPIESLLNYELPNIRPPAPPPPPPKPKPKSRPKEKAKKTKVDRRAALERKRQERLRALDSSPGFRAPRTRAAMAAAVAFEAEVGGDTRTPEQEVAESSSAAENAAGPSTAEKPPRKPRRSVAPPPENIPLTVENVDNRKSFTMFEQGWILPADQKRGGRPIVERQPLPSKKKSKSSRYSVASSGPADRSSSIAAETEASVAATADNMHDISRALEESFPVPIPPLPPQPHEQQYDEPLESTPLTEPPEIVPGPMHVESLVDTTSSSVPPEAEAAEVPMDVDQTFVVQTSSEDAATASPVEEEMAERVPSEQLETRKQDVQDVQEPAEWAQAEESQTQADEQEVREQVAEAYEPETQAEEVPDEEAPDEAQMEEVQAEEARVEQAETDEAHVEEAQVEEAQFGKEPLREPYAEGAQTEELQFEDAPLEDAQLDEAHTEEVGLGEAQGDVAEAGEAHGQDVQGEPHAQEQAPAGEEEEDSGPPRIIIIEELDTPATRREKNMRKKMERQAAREAAAREAAARSVATGSSTAPAPRHEQPIAGPSRLRDEELGEDDSDLTDLSEVEGTTQRSEEIPGSAGPGVLQQPTEGPVVFRSSRRKPPPPVEVEPGAIMLKPGERLEGGTLVWAKIESFPWWPAVVFEPDDPEIPESVLARAPPREADLELVKFYEKKHINNWAWVRHRNMRYLGEDDWLDAQMLAPTSRYQRWRTSSRRTECRNAYQDALAEMDIENPESQAASPTRTQTRSSTAAGSPKKASADETSEAKPNAPTGERHQFHVDSLVPAAMGADSPMTDVDSIG
ncbi:hypothetical protein GY45DRAFT_1310767 [Cubamyces sp. BRFM 1775]|nr:hypothetical protein GY45DRAFT_1310767 [Cubamyces sp. BRFM 1775]